jgi:ribosomal protein S18 acetylase RimI-like enzyme
VIIKPLVSRDRYKILRILRQRGIFNPEEIRVAMEILDETLHQPKQRDYQVFCAFHDTKDTVGYICFGPIPMTDNCYDLYWIAVDEAYSRKGVGGSLLEFMEGFLRRKKARQIYVDTSSSAPYAAARSFYEKNGYAVVCVLDDFYRRGDHRMIFMKKVGGVALSGIEEGAARKALHRNPQRISSAS